MVPWRWLGVVGVLAVLAGLLAWLVAWPWVRLADERAAHERTVARQAEVHADWQREARLATEAARAVERRRVVAFEEVANETHERLERARADAERARGAAAGLRAQLEAFRAASGGGGAGDSGSAAAGAAGASALDLLAELFSGADDAAGELAAALDRSHAAGLACERAHAALRGDGDGPAGVAR